MLEKKMKKAKKREEKLQKREEERLEKEVSMQPAYVPTTMEPLNKGLVWDQSFCPCRKVVLFWRSIFYIERCSLNSLFRSVLYWSVLVC